MESRGLKSIPLPYQADEKNVPHIPSQYSRQQFLPSFLKNLRQDDIILIALIVLLLMEGSECDFLLIGILVVVFLAGLDGNLGF